MVMRGRRRGRKRHSAQHGQDPGTATGAGETSTGAVTLVTSTPPPEDASEQLSPEASVMNDTPPAGVAVLPQDEEQGHDRPEPDKPAVAESVEAEVALPVTTAAPEVVSPAPPPAAATEIADTAAQGSPTPSVEEVVESVAEPATKLTAESVASDAVRAPQAASGNSLPRVLAVANQKGGVGKTTTSVNLGAALAELGFRVLVIDLDPQGNATTGLGIDARTFELSMYDVLMRDISLEDCVEPTSMKNLFVAPATIALAGAEIELVPAFSRELKLKRAIESVIDEFDYVLIDCPPSLGLLTVNALAAAGEVLVPIQCEYYALDGYKHLAGSGKSVDGEEAEGRGTIDQYVVELVDHRLDSPLELQFAAERGDQFDLRPGQRDGRRCHEEVLHAGRLYAVLERDIPHQHVVHREFEGAGVDTQTRCRIALRVEVDHEDPEPEFGQSCSEIDRRGGLSHPALLVGYGKHPGQRIARSGLRCTDSVRCHTFRGELGCRLGDTLDHFFNRRGGTALGRGVRDLCGGRRRWRRAHDLRGRRSDRKGHFGLDRLCDSRLVGFGPVMALFLILR